MKDLPVATIEDVQRALLDHHYIADRSLATTLFLSLTLDKPLLLEGEAGVGKTEVGKVLAEILKTRLIRLQCYEGIDVNNAVYEWAYAKQMLHIRLLESAGSKREETEREIYSHQFLVKRPLLQAIESDGAMPPVLLIDEIDRADDEFEAFLLELLSDFQISIPELGRIEARTQPVVLLTSNNTRELTEALKRRCLYLWLDYPDLEHELEIVRLHSPDLNEQVARKLVEIVGQVRELDLKKPPSIAESIDWARALILLGAEDIDGDVFRQTMSVIVKHRTDLDTVAARVGVKLQENAA
jgi:MoxR-like ATPase